MKKVIILLFLLFFAAGCSSAFKKFDEFAKEAVPKGDFQKVAVNVKYGPYTTTFEAHGGTKDNDLMMIENVIFSWDGTVSHIDMVVEGLILDVSDRE